MTFLADSNPTFLWVSRSRGWGDWIAAGQPGPRNRATGMQLPATAFWAADARAMRDMARALGDRAADSTYGLAPTALRVSAAQHVVEAIAAHDGHLSTGFLGTPNVLPVLSDAGRDDIAYDLLLTASVPSWLYLVDRGATTMWETWDADTQRDYSQNHYAYGAVAGWLLQHAVGITPPSWTAGRRE